jgi:hypothetical protein
MHHDQGQEFAEGQLEFHYLIGLGLFWDILQLQSAKSLSVVR